MVKKLDKSLQPVGIGLVIGIAIGAAMDNVGLGIALGLVFGAAIGETARKKDYSPRCSYWE